MNQEDIKNEILSRIRSGKPTNRPLPEIPLYSYPGNPLENFIGKLLSFDGRAIKFKSRHDAVAWLETQPEMNRDKEIIYSSAAGVDLRYRKQHGRGRNGLRMGNRQESTSCSLRTYVAAAVHIS